jgi:hypothetical protein
MSIYERAGVTANATIAVNLSGTAPPPAASGADAGPQGGRDAEAGNAAAGGASIQQIPGRLDVLKWPLVAGFIGMFALGAILLARKPVAVVANVATGPAENTSGPKLRKKQVSAAPQQAEASLSHVDAAVSTSLDSLKDTLFRLELRRQAGTISEEEYARERARAEKVLRDLVRG